HWDRLLHPHNVTRLKAFWPFYQVKFHRFAFVQSAITILLDGGEMNEDVLTGRALDEPVSFSLVEPLYCPLLSHKEFLSPLLGNLTFTCSVKLTLLTTPLEACAAQPE